MVITIEFSTGATSGEVAIWIDVNQDGLLDPAVDMDIEEVESFSDNDFEDEDLTVGIFKITLGGGGEEGFSRVALAQFLFEVTDAGGSDTAWVYIEPLVSDYSFAGSVTPAVANVIIGAFPSGMTGGPDGPDGPGEAPWMTVTDGSGNYQLTVPESIEYDVFAFDLLGVQDGLIADTSYHMVDASLNLADIDFNFIVPTSFIEGFVTDKDGLPVTGVVVFVGGGPGGEQEDSSNAIGFYSIGVAPGHYWVEVDEDVIPDYMAPEGQEVEVLDGETATANFTLYVADATISGIVTLDELPLAGIGIEAWGHPVGWTFGMSGGDGIYTLHVSSEVDFEGYNIWPEDQPDSTYFTDKLWNISPGVSGVDIHFLTAAGGLTGVVTVAGSSPVDTLYEVDIMVRTTTGDEYHTSPDWETGVYELFLPVGSYGVEVWDREQRFMPFKSDSPVTVGTTLLNYPIELNPIVFDAVIFGNVSDCDAAFTLGGAEVGVYNHAMDWGDWTVTDSVGDFYFEVPAGEYDVWVDAEGYRGDWQQVTAPSGGEVLADFCLWPFTFEAPYITRIIDRGRSEHPDDAPDQGGWAYLEFEGGGTQEGPYIGWNIWRVPGPDYFPEQMVNVGFVRTHGEPNYTVLVPTRVDSGAAYPTPEEYLSHYVVTGYTGGDFFEWFDSDVGNGYSVDNIVPGVPSGTQIVGTANGVQLSWEASVDEDFQYYAVYRSEESGVYGPTPYAVVADPVFEDAALLAVTTYYVVTTVDANGNESAFSLEKNSTTLAVDEFAGLPATFALKANYPNPFNPSTTIRYQLPAAGQVSLTIYDLMGKQVRTLVDEAGSAGYYQAVWDGRNANGASVATGVYFYRITVDNAFTQTRKMVLMK